MAKCSICRRREAAGHMCEPCQRSYDRDNASGDGTIWGALRWAARRARRFDRRNRKARLAPPACICMRSGSGFLRHEDCPKHGGRVVDDGFDENGMPKFKLIRS